MISLIMTQNDTRYRNASMQFIILYYLKNRLGIYHYYKTANRWRSKQRKGRYFINSLKVGSISSTYLLVIINITSEISYQ